VEAKAATRNQFLAVEMLARPPMTPHLSGLEVEYAVAVIYSRDAGTREATIAFDVTGQRRIPASARRCQCCSTSNPLCA